MCFICFYKAQQQSIQVQQQSIQAQQQSIQAPRQYSYQQSSYQQVNYQPQQQLYQNQQQIRFQQQYRNVQQQAIPNYRNVQMGLQNTINSVAQMANLTQLSMNFPNAYSTASSTPNYSNYAGSNLQKASTRSQSYSRSSPNIIEIRSSDTTNKSPALGIYLILR